MLPHAYQLEIGPVFKVRLPRSHAHADGVDAPAVEQAELDSLVAKMKMTEARVAQLDERRKCVHRAQRSNDSD